MRHIYWQSSNLLTPLFQTLPIRNSRLDATTSISKECGCRILNSVVEQHIVPVVGMLTGGDFDVCPEQAKVRTKEDVGFG
jgi:hypothetical protein